MKTSNQPETFETYFRSYLSSHQSPVSRACHAGGILLAVAVAALLVATGMFFFLPVAIVIADLGARLGHKLAPRDGHEHAASPLWAARADLRMSAMLLAGRLGRDGDSSQAAA